MERLIFGAYLFSVGLGDALQDSSYSALSHPWSPPKGTVELGVMHPWAWTPTDKLTVTTSGLVTLISPDVAVRYSLHPNLAVVGGLSVPTPALRLMQGLPLDASQTIPWSVIPSLGLTAGKMGTVYWGSVGVLGRAGLNLGDPGAIPVQPVELAFLDPQLAPMTEGYAVAFMGSAGKMPDIPMEGGMGWGATAEARVQLGGGPDAQLRVMGIGAWKSGEKLHNLELGAVVSNDAYGFGRAWRWAPRAGWSISF